MLTLTLILPTQLQAFNMTAKELIMNGKDKVRRDSNLMHFYLILFKETFNETPNCISCSFSRDWNRFSAYHKNNSIDLIANEKITIMEDIKIKKVQGKILSYKKDGKTYRLYDNLLTNVFISEFLTYGTDEEIADRKKLFNIPVKIQDVEEISPIKTKRKRVK